jgi:NAD(P)-dependent dehydrogenase (short-subunit alcohol dehydrogenase family)
MMTDMLEENMRQNPGNRKQFEDSNMLKRIARPDELNAVMIYLMSEASSYVTGNDFQVDGGIIGLMS